jgi:hypothetical protein
LTTQLAQLEMCTHDRPTNKYMSSEGALRLKREPIKGDN